MRVPEYSVKFFRKLSAVASFKGKKLIRLRLQEVDKSAFKIDQNSYTFLTLGAKQLQTFETRISLRNQNYLIKK